MAVVGQENGSPPGVETYSVDDTTCKAWHPLEPLAVWDSLQAGAQRSFAF